MTMTEHDAPRPSLARRVLRVRRVRPTSRAPARLRSRLAPLVAAAAVGAAIGACLTAWSLWSEHDGGIPALEATGAAPANPLATPAPIALAPAEKAQEQPAPHAPVFGQEPQNVQWGSTKARVRRLSETELAALSDYLAPDSAPLLVLNVVSSRPSPLRQGDVILGGCAPSSPPDLQRSAEDGVEAECLLVSRDREPEPILLTP